MPAGPGGAHGTDHRLVGSQPGEEAGGEVGGVLDAQQRRRRPARTRRCRSRPSRARAAGSGPRRRRGKAPGRLSGSRPSPSQNCAKAGQMVRRQDAAEVDYESLRRHVGRAGYSRGARRHRPRRASRAWFEANVEGAQPPLAFERISGGRSNLTFGVADAAGHRWALRRPPLGKRLGSAHDMGREHRVISALQDTPVPVPPVAGFCDDESVNEAPFYVMGFVDGPILRSQREARRRASTRPSVTRSASASSTPWSRSTMWIPTPSGWASWARRRTTSRASSTAGTGSGRSRKTRELPLVDDVHDRLSPGSRSRAPPPSFTATTAWTT